MRAGPLRHFVTLQRPIKTRTDSGAVRDDFEDWLPDIKAEVLDVTGGERWVQAQVAADVTTRIRIRYRAGVTADMRVVQRALPGSPTALDVFDIESVIKADGRKVELHLFCRRRDAEGFRTGER